MKLIPLLSLVALTYAAPLAEESVVENVQAESPMASLYSSTEQGVRVVPRLEDTKLPAGAKRSTVKYGPWDVSKQMSTKTLLASRSAICTGECLITAMQATIKYTKDGTEANINNNAWLHHIALFGSGAGGGSLWACGNERPTLRLDTSEKYGLDWPTTWMMMVDLMTEDPGVKNIGLYITYEYQSKTSGYKKADMYWLTIGEPAAKNGVYSFRTQTSTVTAGGKLLYTIGHMHDGGTDMRLFKNGDKTTPLCKSIMHYNARPGYNPPGGAGGMAGMPGMSHSNAVNAPDAPFDAGANHISDPGACLNFGAVKAQDKLSAEAWYDANKYPLMVHNNKKENLMGNMRVYIGP